MKISWGWVVAGMLAGWIVSDVFIVPMQDNRSCETAARENKALEQCLRHRPACTSVTVEDFAQYHENKDWLDANCPAHSGDGFLSQQ